MYLDEIQDYFFYSSFTLCENTYVYASITDKQCALLFSACPLG